MFTRRSVLIIVLMLLLVALAACGGGGDSTSSQAEEEAVAVSSGDPDAGKEQYDMLCIACHGPGGEGIEGLGKAFTTSEFLRERSDEEMLEFIKVGRPSSDPLNTTGVDMPPKGGNPALTDDQIIDIVAFVRTLHE
ncbi:MAG: c-type cytochrome [Chloroflexi bacterium]|jgi:disulfide bond formation protein DsbB|nr:c-type cytochrome [Chloroflexota bacterium]